MITQERVRVSTGLRLPRELKKYVDEIAEHKGISKNALILEALWQYVEKKKE